jgi:hypothetical protein
MKIKKGQYKQAITEAILTHPTNEFTVADIVKELPEIAYKTISAAVSNMVTKKEIIRISRGGGMGKSAIYSRKKSDRFEENLPNKVWQIIFDFFAKENFTTKSIQDHLPKDISANHISKTLANMAFSKKGIKRIKRGGPGIPATYCIDYDSIAAEAEKKRKETEATAKTDQTKKLHAPPVIKKRPTPPTGLQMTKIQLADAVHQMFENYHNKIKDLELQVELIKDERQKLQNKIKSIDIQHLNQLQNLRQQKEKLADEIVLLKRQKSEEKDETITLRSLNP